LAENAEPSVRAGFVLIPDSGHSKVQYIAISAPAKYGVYRATFLRLDTNRTVIIRIKEIVISATKAAALPYLPGIVTA
jgi:hypothetical protein